MGNLVLVPDGDIDSKVIVDVAQLKEFNLEKWVGEMKMEKLCDLKEVCEKYKKFPLGDTSVRQYATLIEEMEQIEDYFLVS